MDGLGSFQFIISSHLLASKAEDSLMLMPRNTRPCNRNVSSQNQLANRTNFLLAALAAFVGCAPVIKQAEVPRVPSTGDQAQREAVAAQYGLTRDSKNTWTRAD